MCCNRRKDCIFLPLVTPGNSSPQLNFYFSEHHEGGDLTIVSVIFTEKVMSSYFNSLASRIRSRSSGRGTGVGSEESGSDSDSSSEESRNGERQDETLQLPSELAIQLDTIEVLGAYGWSSQLSCSYYHEDLSLIFAGTEEGSLNTTQAPISNSVSYSLLTGEASPK